MEVRGEAERTLSQAPRKRRVADDEGVERTSQTDPTRPHRGKRRGSGASVVMRALDQSDSKASVPYRKRRGSGASLVVRALEEPPKPSGRYADKPGAAERRR